MLSEKITESLKGFIKFVVARNKNLIWRLGSFVFQLKFFISDYCVEQWSILFSLKSYHLESFQFLVEEGRLNAKKKIGYGKSYLAIVRS